MWISPAPPGVGRSDVKIRSARNSSRKNICEILRKSGNLEGAKDLPTHFQEQSTCLME